MIAAAGPRRPRAYALYRFLWSALDWLYPPRCAGCGQAGTRWCLTCQSRCQPICGPVCQTCGEPYRHGALCSDCRSSPPQYRALRSWAVFAGPLREAHHRLKYRQDLGVGEALSPHLIQLLQELSWPVQLVVPVPLSPKRLRERGYNQAALLARPLALATGLSYRPRALSRVRETPTQVGLREKERLQNVMGAFGADPNQVNGKTVLVIDDVATTGATLNSCAQALLTAGAKNVYGLTLARATYRNDIATDTLTGLP